MASFSARRALTSLVTRTVSAQRCSKQAFGTTDSILVNICRPNGCQAKAPISGGFGSAIPENGGLFRRFSSSLAGGKVPREIAAVESLLPLYSVTASSRLVSQLSKNVGAAPANLHGMRLHVSPDR